MAYNVFDAAKDAVTGNLERVTSEVKQSRLDVCKTCDHFKKISRQCELCGCFLDLKTELTRAECPIKKW
jgi:hypothetical protein